MEVCLLQSSHLEGHYEITMNLFGKMHCWNYKRSNPASINDMNSKVLASLDLSYKYLESEEAKSFFLLCSLFPEGHHISRDDMLIVWDAGGPLS